MSTTKAKPINIVAVIISFILGIIFISGLVVVTHGFWFGWLTPYWDNMTNAQGSVVGAGLTVFAAAFAGVFAPMLFQGVIKDVRDQVAETMSEVSKLAQQTRNAFHTLNDTALSEAGIKTTYTPADLGRSREILRVIQARTAEFAQTAKDKSPKWKKQEEFKGKWPTRYSYVKLLKEHDMIDREQLTYFNTIIDSRKFTHAENRREIDIVQLNLVAAAFSALEDEFDESD